MIFIQKLSQAETDAANLKQRAQQVRYDANRNNGSAEVLTADNSDYEEQKARANNAQNDAHEAEIKSSDADTLLHKLQTQVKDRTTIIARPTGKMIAPLIRQWQFQAMAIYDPPQ